VKPLMRRMRYNEAN